ncbi:MAG TPA: aminoimidazole riboside kinase [Bacillales bacterium]|nr:aminoimidazole riboside kinase [Bacillales bacterium]
MKSGVICLGEALIDFIPTDATNTFYEKCPGGAPANVAVGLAKLGVPADFIGKVGKDPLGAFLIDTLRNYGVNVSGMAVGDEAKTGFTFVTLDESGDRDFDFFIRPSADQFLNESDIDQSAFRGKKLLHLGTISMISKMSRGATKKAIRLAKDEGLLVSFDPNIRFGLWDSEDQVKEAIVEVLPDTDLLKVSEEELSFLTGKEEIAEGVRSLESYGIPMIVVTQGAEGSLVFTHDAEIKVQAMKVEAVDTTGAGDAYVSGILCGLHESDKPLSDLDENELLEIARLASVSGGLAASNKGAMSALPDLAEVTKRLREQG